MEMARLLIFLLMITSEAAAAVLAEDENGAANGPCEDSEVRRSDGFTFGIAFAGTSESFYINNVEYSPCDSRIGLAKQNARVAVFRPYVDEISLLSVKTSDFPAIFSGMYMVAFAGRRYAAISLPIFVGNSTYIVTSFTLVLEFQKGILEKLYWKKDGCSGCMRETDDFSCLETDVCGLHTSKCTTQGGTYDCNLGIQLAFSGTDMSDRVLNSWYEVSKLRQYSLFNLFADLKDSIKNPFF